jgi:hypothetical protein
MAGIEEKEDLKEAAETKGKALGNQPATRITVQAVELREEKKEKELMAAACPRLRGDIAYQTQGSCEAKMAAAAVVVEEKLLLKTLQRKLWSTVGRRTVEVAVLAEGSQVDAVVRPIAVVTVGGRCCRRHG